MNSNLIIAPFGAIIIYMAEEVENDKTHDPIKELKESKLIHGDLGIDKIILVECSVIHIPNFVDTLNKIERYTDYKLVGNVSSVGNHRDLYYLATFKL